MLQRPVAWLVEQGVTHVAMEATGVYWKPVFHALCEAEQIEVLLVNARQGQQGDQGPAPPDRRRRSDTCRPPRRSWSVRGTTPRRAGVRTKQR